MLYAAVFHIAFVSVVVIGVWLTDRYFDRKIAERLDKYHED